MSKTKSRPSKPESPTTFHSLKTLKHDPSLAIALGEMVVAWAHAETILLGALARVSGARLNLIQAGYYRIPTFESRVKFILGMMTEWQTKQFDTSAISTAIEKLSKLASARNHWVHGDWCAAANTKEIVIFDQRAALNSPHRRKPVRAADVKNHCEAVIKRADELESLIDWESLPI